MNTAAKTLNKAVTRGTDYIYIYIYIYIVIYIKVPSFLKKMVSDNREGSTTAIICNTKAEYFS